MRQISNFLIIILIIVGLVFFLHYLKILSVIENGVNFLFQGITKKIYGLTVDFSSFYHKIYSWGALQQENEQLKREKIKLLNQQAYCLELEKENQFLSQQLDFLKKTHYHGQIARVIGQNPDPNISALIIDKGKHHGIKKDQPVVVNDGVLIGKIFKVNQYTSVVLLINDNLSKIAASNVNQRAVMGLVEGEYGLGIKMNFILPEAKIHKGDLIITAGIEPTIPRGLIIGEISSIIKEPESLFQQATIRPAVNIKEIYLVNVLTKTTLE